MNRRALVVGVVAALIGSALWFALINDTAVAPSSEHASRPGSSGSVKRNQTATVSESLSGTGSFQDLVGLGKDLMCDFSFVAEKTNAAIAGTIKVSGANFRSDFEMQQAGETYQSHLIQSGQYTYSWTESDAGVVAVRMNMNELAVAERPVIMNSAVDYTCQAWTADIAVFVPPGDLEFVDQAELMRERTSPAETQ